MRELRRFEPALVALAMMIATGSARAQTSGRTEDPLQFLAAPADPVEYYRKSLAAGKLVDEKKWADAEALLRELTRAYPFSTGIVPSYANWTRLGTALREQGKHEEAIRAYEKAIELQGPGPSYAGLSNVRYWIAVSQTALGRHVQALDTLAKMVDEDRYLARPSLFDDPNFAPLRKEARFRAIAGKRDVAKLDRVAGWRLDVDSFMAELRRSNPTGAPIPDEVFRRARELRAAIPTLDDAHVVAGLGHILNALDRGHTAMWLDDPSGGTRLDFRPLPVRLYVFPEGVFITETWPGAEGLAGARVLEIGGLPVAEALRRVGDDTANESPMQILWTGPDYLGRPGALVGLGMASRADRATLKLALPDGTVVTRTRQVHDETPRTDWSGRLNPPPGVPPPLFLSHNHENHWFTPLPEHDAMYVQVNNILPDEDETLPQLALRLRRALDERRPRALILDLRHDNGGNSFSYPELLRTLIAFSAVEGHQVYVIIGRSVYSAAANLTTDLERLVRPVFVGEPTSGSGNQWGDESPFTLPYSGLTGSFAGVRWQLSHPWDVRRSIVPQVPVQLTARDYFAGKDPVLDTVFRLIDVEGRPAPAPR